MKICERAHKKLSKQGERGKPMEAVQGTLSAAGVGRTCGGTIEEVLSGDGTKVYGERCNRCGHATTRCQVCGRMFANINRHLGNHNPCWAGNEEYRRGQAISKRMYAMGEVR